MKSSSNSYSPSSLICKVVLLSSALSGCELHLFTSKQSLCLLFFYQLLFHARPVKEMYSNSLRLWSFPPDLDAWFVQSPLFSFMLVWKLTTEADPIPHFTTRPFLAKNSQLSAWCVLLLRPNVYFLFITLVQFNSPKFSKQHCRVHIHIHCFQKDPLQFF